METLSAAFRKKGRRHRDSSTVVKGSKETLDRFISSDRIKGLPQARAKGRHQISIRRTMKYTVDELIGESGYLLRQALDASSLDPKQRREIIRNFERAVQNEYKYLLRESK